MAYEADPVLGLVVLDDAGARDVRRAPGANERAVDENFAAEILTVTLRAAGAAFEVVLAASKRALLRDRSEVELGGGRFCSRCGCFTRCRCRLLRFARFPRLRWVGGGFFCRAPFDFFDLGARQRE